MNFEQAMEILKPWIETPWKLRGHYLNRGDEIDFDDDFKIVCIEGGFTADELEAIAIYMRGAQKEKE